MNDLALCTKTVQMNGDGVVAFISGKIYKCRGRNTAGYTLVDETKRDHGTSSSWFNEHFILVSESFNMVCVRDVHISKVTKGKTYGVYLENENTLCITNDQGVKIELSPEFICKHFEPIRGYGFE
jgi:hypothetical protein